MPWPAYSAAGDFDDCFTPNNGHRPTDPGRQLCAKIVHGAEMPPPINKSGLDTLGSA
jgi:hypothetical protein